MSAEIRNTTRRRKVARRQFPQDPLERCHHRWHRLFFGVWAALARHDRRLVLRLLLALEKAGLAKWAGDVLTFVPQLFEVNPSNEILDRTARFREIESPLPPLRGRLKHGYLRVPYYQILSVYYHELFEARQRREKAAHEKAIEEAAHQLRYTAAAVRKHLEKARKLHPVQVKFWKRRGAEWEEST